MGTAYISHLRGTTTESESGIFGIKQKDKLNSRRDRQKIISFPILFKICLGQSIMLICRYFK